MKRASPVRDRVMSLLESEPKAKPDRVAQFMGWSVAEACDRLCELARAGFIAKAGRVTVGRGKRTSQIQTWVVADEQTQARARRRRDEARISARIRHVAARNPDSGETASSIVSQALPMAQLLFVTAGREWPPSPGVAA